MNSKEIDPATLGYEQAREELMRVVTQLESGTAGLEESLSLWERGEALANRCEEWLSGARERLAKVQEQHCTLPSEAGQLQ